MQLHGRCSGDVLVAEGLVKKFKRGPMIGPVSLRIGPGSVYALIGPNGAGKTTTIRMILGIYRPDAGYVKICGVDPYTGRGAHGLAAYVPEETAVYPRLTGYEHLWFYAGLYTGDPGETKRIVERAAALSELGEALTRPVESYSKGMKRKLLLALALALNTPLLVLDEPTSGLDVYSAVRIRQLIRRAAEEGRAVLVTSHNMLEVERIADRVAFIAKGRIVDEGRPDELIQKYGARDLEEAFVKAVPRQRQGAGKG
ncbi:ABC transporter ATP-binding protein [Pyrodictium abyssi]|uniref:ABC transporter ATP-binding protein n=1 Tax=Pyrodictium abyssi TaxID=54256 RepID=A0ABN6ZP23_9CREN|nr:ABC transporter ATP-binding protein [Pyrodictium abyssi]